MLTRVPEAETQTKLPDTTEPHPCGAPALIDLNDIPDNPELEDRDPARVAIFEVRGHRLVGKFVRDEAAARGAMKLWQEVAFRVPENQLDDVVQFEIHSHGDGENTDYHTNYDAEADQVHTERFGLRLTFSIADIVSNQPDVCAPLDPRRDTFDWGLLYDVAQVRGRLDGSRDRFREMFPFEVAPGAEYPQDGSPSLSGEFVNANAGLSAVSDYGNTFAVFAMLSESAIPAPVAGESRAVQKVRWMSEQPGFVELRRALRITEPDGSNAPIDPAPALIEDLPITSPTWLHGTWQESPGDGYRLEVTGEDIISSRIVGGVETERTSMRELQRARILYETESVSASDEHFAYVAQVHRRTWFDDSFARIVSGPMQGQITFTRAGLIDDVLLTRTIE